MTHLSPGELRAWFDRGHADDRERVMTHLARCADCRGALAHIAATDTPALLPANVASPPARAVHHTASDRARPAASRQTWGKALPVGLWMIGILIFAAGLQWQESRWQESSSRRIDAGGSHLQVVGPIGEISGPIRFRWASAFDAERYRVILRAPTGSTLHTAVVKEAEFTAATDLVGRLKAGATYEWQVEAVTTTGEVIATSPPVAFKYRP